MKRLMLVLTVIAISLFATAVIADEFTLGTGNDMWTVVNDRPADVIWSEWPSKPLREQQYKDVGVMLYEDHLADEKALAEAGKRGIAAGGLGRAAPVVDENTRIWEALFNTGSDLP